MLWYSHWYVEYFPIKSQNFSIFALTVFFTSALWLVLFENKEKEMKREERKEEMWDEGKVCGKPVCNLKMKSGWRRCQRKRCESSQGTFSAKPIDGDAKVNQWRKTRYGKNELVGHTSGKDRSREWETPKITIDRGSVDDDSKPFPRAFSPRLSLYLFHAFYRLPIYSSFSLFSLCTIVTVIVAATTCGFFTASSYSVTCTRSPCKNAVKYFWIV